MIQELINFLSDKRITIIGFGKEGRSALNFLRKNLPNNPKPAILDMNQDIQNDELLNGLSKQWIGSNWLENIPPTDLYIKSPGVKLPPLSDIGINKNSITSQTELFLRFFGKKTIGITGTKGKSTVSSLIYHILDACGVPASLAGNIGKPVLDIISNEMPEWVVLELSSHQLENCQFSPHIAVLLNIYQEHLDHYDSFESYIKAKLNVLLHQRHSDIAIASKQVIDLTGNISQDIVSNYLIYDYDQPKFNANNSIELPNGSKLDFCEKKWTLAGEHNLINLVFALQVAELCGIPANKALDAAYSFKGLAHRLEFVGEFQEILFYNDSIATIPEASICAVKSLKNVDTLILGGFDRGIDYSKMADFLPKSGVSNIILMGDVGKVIKKLIGKSLKGDQFIYCAENLQLAIEFAYKNTKKGSICLLSPAAASYDKFKNFEERGKVFTELVRSINKSYSNKSA